MAEIVPAVAAKVTEVADAGTMTDAGTVSARALLARETLVPPTGAALEIITVQVLLALDGRVAGLHASAETVGGGAVRLMLVVAEAPLSVAVTVAT